MEKCVERKSWCFFFFEEKNWWVFGFFLFGIWWNLWYNSTCVRVGVL